MFTTVNQMQGTRITDCLYDLALKIRDKKDSLPFLGQCFRLTHYVLINDSFLTNNQIATKQDIVSVLLEFSI